MLKRFPDTTNCLYDLTETPVGLVCRPLKHDEPSPTDGVRWGSETPPPSIGDRVRINFNSLGEGTVESYFAEQHFLGLCVKLDTVPAWKKKQPLIRAEVALVFAVEIAR